MKPPRTPGWYWFLPAPECPTPTGLLRLDRPVILLVGQEQQTIDGMPPRLIVRFGAETQMFVEHMVGDWAEVKEPKSMRKKALQRIQAKKMSR